MNMNQSETKVNIESKNALARLMATENLQIEHSKVPTASFDVKNRVLRLPLWKDMDSNMYEGLIGHEVGHALYTSYEDWGDFVENYPDLKDYANIIEDARIEKKMKTKYPGMKKTFFQMYDTLATRDFFGTQGRDIESYGFADRLNIFFKLGVRAEVPFSDEEILFRNRVAAAETFEDVAALAKELGEMGKKEASETNHEDIDYVLSDEEEDEDDDFETIEVNVTASKKSDEEKEESEEKETGLSAKSSEPEEADEDEDEDDDEKGEETPSDANGTPNEESFQDDIPPKPETQAAFDEAMEQMNDDFAAEPIYLDLPTVNYKNSVSPWKTTFEQLNTHWADPSNFANYYEPEVQAKAKKENEQLFRVWKKDTLQVVNYMVKEFEMKQAATAYRRTATARSGVLDMNKLHKYKTDEDIFKRVTSVQDGRNHALMIFVDWSGSMSGKMQATMKQTLTLVMFAKKVGIPFRVYSFSNSNQLCSSLGQDNTPFYSKSQNSQAHLAMDMLAMNEYFNEKMSAKDFNKQVQNMFFLGKSLDYNGLNVPMYHSMSSTPLNECILASYDMIKDFKKETGKEKVNAIFLTDGGADGNTTYYSDAQSEERYIGYSSSQRLVLRDPKTKQLMMNTGTRHGLTEALLKNLAYRCQINVIGFHITDRRTINQTIQWGLGYEEGAKMKSFVNKNGYAPFKEAGYNTYFLINDKAMDKENEFDEPERNTDGSVAKGKLRTQFKKFTSARKVNKMMLNEFVALVA